MTIIEYAKHLSALALWSAGKVDKSQAYYHWEQLLKANYTTVAVPSRKNWPSQVKRPPTKEDPDPGVWGSWKHLLAAVSPIGFVGLMIGDEEFRGEVQKSAEEGAKAVSGSLFGFLPWVGLGALTYVYLTNRK